jgi:GntR family transcriptional regulator, transcriptional repressor for pyruvate dehydrogenase complex
MPLETIQPLQRVSLFEALAAQIEEWILSGTLDPGAKLPSEGSLSRQFGVSRPVVREAFAQLRERGLIETVSGSGTFVKRPDADHLTDAVLRHLRAAGGTQSLAKVYEARLAIESTAARLAAERATGRDLEQIASHLDAMRTAGKDEQQWTAADLGFHVAVAEASHNPFLSTLLAPLVKVIEQTIAESFRSSKAAVRAGLNAHERIHDCIADHDPAGAEQAMRDHLTDSERRLTATLARSPRAEAVG